MKKDTILDKNNGDPEYQDEKTMEILLKNIMSDSNSGQSKIKGQIEWHIGDVTKGYANGSLYQTQVALLETKWDHLKRFNEHYGKLEYDL